MGGLLSAGRHVAQRAWLGLPIIESHGHGHGQKMSRKNMDNCPRIKTIKMIYFHFTTHIITKFTTKKNYVTKTHIREKIR